MVSCKKIVKDIALYTAVSTMLIGFCVFGSNYEPSLGKGFDQLSDKCTYEVIDKQVDSTIGVQNTFIVEDIKSKERKTISVKSNIFFKAIIMML